MEPETGRARRARSRRDTGLEPTAPPRRAATWGGDDGHGTRGAARHGRRRPRRHPTPQRSRPAGDRPRPPRPPHRPPPAEGRRGLGTQPTDGGARRDHARPRGAARDGERRRGVPRAAAGATRTPGGAASHAPRASTRGRPRRGGGTHFSGTRVRREGPLLHREGPRPGGGGHGTARGGGPAGSPRAATPQPRTPDRRPPRHRHLGHATLARPSLFRTPLPLCARAAADGGTAPRDARLPPPGHHHPPQRARRRATGAGGGGAELGGGGGRRGEAGARRPGLHLGGRRARQSGPYEEAPSRATPGDNPRVAIDRQATLRQA